MSLTSRELWAAIHGMIFGATFLLGFAGGLAGLYSLRSRLLTEEGIRERLGRLKLGTALMAIAAWGTVLTGTYMVYPWYRAAAPDGAALADYPRNFLLANPNLAAWHTFGMEWKEHIAWFSPILAVAVAYLVFKYAAGLADNAKLRWMIVVLYMLAFGTAAVAGLLGALITKAAPIL